MTKQAADLTARLMTALKCRKVEAILPRLKELGLADTCTRCGGGGEYSFNLMSGTTCFGCNGGGRKMPKITVAFINRVAEAVNAGGLNDYFARIDRKNAAAKKIEQMHVTHKPIADAYSAAYTAERNDGEPLPVWLFELQGRANDLVYGKHVYKGKKDEQFGGSDIKSAFEYTRNMPIDRLNKLLDRLDECVRLLDEVMTEFRAKVANVK